MNYFSTNLNLFNVYETLNVVDTIDAKREG